jgi:hypothetical protein
MSPAIVLSAAAAMVLVSALAKSKRRNREGMSLRSVSTGHDSFELLADNLKTTTKKVDNSAAAVEVALKRLLAA